MATKTKNLTNYTQQNKSVLEPSGPASQNLSQFPCSMKWLGVSLLPPGWDACPLQGYPPSPKHFIGLSWQLAIYTPSWREAEAP